MEQQQTDLRAAFVRAVEDQVGKGIYVWGGNGERLDGMSDPVAWIERHEQSATDAKRAVTLFKTRREAGEPEIRAFDCSGLVYWALKGLGVLKTDVNSRGLYALCRPLNEDEIEAGDLVFHHDGTRIVHVGVCAGEQQIECKGRDDGVVRNKRKKGYWNRFGRLEALDHRPEAFVYVKGGSVRVRKGPGTDTKCLGVAHRGETFPLLGVEQNGWYRIARDGREAFITGRARYTEVRHG